MSDFNHAQFQVEQAVIPFLEQLEEGESVEDVLMRALAEGVRIGAVEAVATTVEFGIGDRFRGAVGG